MLLKIALILLLIWLVPIGCRKIRVPAIVGFILAGMVIGEHGLGWIGDSEAIDILGKLGMLYIMLQAGIEIDLNDFRHYRIQAVALGLYTFFLPFGLGLFTSRLLGYGWTTSLLLGAMYGSHTLMTYPIVSRYGVQNARATNITVGATMLAITLSLLALAVVRGSANAGTWWVNGIKIPVVGAIILGAFPWIISQAFKRRLHIASNFVLVILLMVLSAYLAEWAGLESILGAFLCGVALNKYVPNLSELMKTINFVGNQLFVPFFLLGVGMIIDIRVMASGWGTLMVAGIMILTKLTGKAMAAFLGQVTMHLQWMERQLIFGLTHATAAGTLAIVTIGYQSGFFDSMILNGAILMILVLCTTSSFVTEHAAKQMALGEKARLESERTEDEWIVLGADSESLHQLATLAQIPEPIYRHMSDWVSTKYMIENSGHSIAVYEEKQPISTIGRIVVAVPRWAEKEWDFISCFGVIRRLSSQLSAKVVFYCHADSKSALEALCNREGKWLNAMFMELSGWEDVAMISKQIRTNDLVIFIQARQSTPSYDPHFERLPKLLSSFFADNSSIVLYPEQLTEEMTTLLSEVPQSSAVWNIEGRIKSRLLPFVQPLGVESQEDKKQNAKSNHGRSAVAKEGQRNADDGQQSQDHTDIDGDMHKEDTDDGIGIDH